MGVRASIVSIVYQWTSNVPMRPHYSFGSVGLLGIMNKYTRIIIGNQRRTPGVNDLIKIGGGAIY